MCEGFLADCLCVAVAVSVGRGDVGYVWDVLERLGWGAGQSFCLDWIGLDWLVVSEKERVEEEVGKQARGWGLE